MAQRSSSQALLDAPAIDAEVFAGDCFKSGCISRRILTHVTGRWGVLLITALGEHSPLRFSELRTRIEGISEKILSQKLREFEADGLITRRDHGVVPPHVDYSLTSLGTGVAGHLEALTTWIENNAAEFLRVCPESAAISRAPMNS